MTKGWLLPLFVLGAACKGGSGKPAPVRKDAGIAALAQAADASEAVPALVTGLPDPAGYAYRTRAGHPAFRTAREAEAAGTWQAVAAACREALAVDPRHLDAAYLLGVALAKTDAAPAHVLEPLGRAVGGDLLKWGRAVVVQPALQPLWSTPLGKAFVARVEEAHRDFTALLGRALLVNANGDVYAFDDTASRWHRLTRTGGAVVGTFRVKHVPKLVYVTRERDAKTKQSHVGIGLIDLAAGRSKRMVRLPAISEAIRVAFNSKDPEVNAFVIYSKGWFALDDRDDVLALRPLDTKEHPGAVGKLAEMASIDVRGRTTRAQRLELPNIAADFDEHRLASALKITQTKRIVTVPSPGLIDGNTVTWSRDRSQLAFVAQLTDDCKAGEPTSAVFVADASTGAPRELERAIGGMAVEWMENRKLAIAGDRGVTIYELGGATTPIAGATSLAIASRNPACATEPAGDEPIAVEDSPSD